MHTSFSGYGETIRKPLNRNKAPLRGFAKTVTVIACGVLIIVATVMFVFPALNPLNSGIVAMERENEAEITGLNEAMARLYERTIYPQGKERIDAELDKVSRLSDPEAKLDEIFVWEMKDWIRPNENLTAFSCLGETCTYAVLKSDPSRMKASPYYDGILYPQKNPNGTMYADDPYWIAYNRIGECREYSALFAFMAQESGIPSRLVRTNSHQWAEVELGGVPYYYGPWCAVTHGYYNATDGNMTFRDKWFNTIGSYEENCNPSDFSIISYNDFPYVWATPKYLGASVLHSVEKKKGAKGQGIAPSALPFSG